MNFRTTLLLGVSTLILGLWILMIDSKTKDTQSLAFESRFILTFDTKKCSQIFLQQKKQTLKLKKREQGIFYLEKPTPAIRANETVISKLLGTFGNLMRSNVRPLTFASEKEFQKALTQYQLASPTETITFLFPDKTSSSIAFGKEDNGTCYARLNQEKSIQILPLRLLHLVKTELKDLRDPYLFHFDQYRLTEIEIELKEQPKIHLIKEKQSLQIYQDWQQIAPYKMFIDPDQLFVLLDALKEQAAQDYIPLAKSPVKIQDPWCTLTLTTSRKETTRQQKLLLFKHENHYYAHNPNTLYLLKFKNENFTQAITFPAWKYRNKKVFHQLEPESLSFQLDATQQFQFVKEKEKWFLTSQKEQKTEVVSELIRPLLDLVTQLQFEEPLFWERTKLDDLGLTETEHQWKMQHKGKEYLLLIGTSKENEFLYAKRNDIPLVFSLKKSTVLQVWQHINVGSLYKSSTDFETKLIKKLEGSPKKE